MAERIAELVVLAEDLRQGNFGWHYLKRAGHNYRQIRLEISPPGRGSGEQYVRERYPAEVKYYRSRSHSRSAALVVATDADMRTVAACEQRLERALLAAREVKRGDNERIGLLIPKRHIETWILCLSDESVNEGTDYKRARPDAGDKVKSSANRFFDLSRTAAEVPPECIPSLRRGLKEIRRLD